MNPSIHPASMPILKNFTLMQAFLLVSLRIRGAISLAHGNERPNILRCISDDQSYAHTSANGAPVFIRNFEPTLCPFGSPDPLVSARSIPYGEIDSAPTKTKLKTIRDPRVVGGRVDWEYYPYYGEVRSKGWAVDPKPSVQ